MSAVNAQTMLRRFVEEDTVLRAYVLAATGNPHDANDIVQNVWKVLWVKIDAYDESRPLRAWAMGVARLEVLKWRQRLARRRESFSERVLELLEATAVEAADDLDVRCEFLDPCLKAAPTTWRRVLKQKYYENLSIREIAERLARSVSAIEMTLVRARRGVRDCVEKKMKAAAGLGMMP